jgi:tetratricopeptide (TPR) repeat protein/capsular polysaccharide biosynthesis protein
LTLQPDLYSSYCNLGYTLYQQSDLVGAVDYYRLAIAIQPDLANAYHDLGIVFDARGQYFLAAQSQRQAIALQSGHVSAYNNLGCALVKLGQIEGAIDSYRSAIAIAPDWATLHHNLAQALFAQGRVAEALVACLHAIELQPDLSSAHYAAARALRCLGQHAQTVMHLQQVIELAPEQIEALGDCAVALMAQGKLSQAVVYLKKAIAKQKVFVDAYCRESGNLAEQDDLSSARATCIQLLDSIQQNVEPAQLHSSIQKIYIYFGKVMDQYGGHKLHQQAEVYYREALETQPQNGELYELLGNCLTRQQRLQEAVECYRKALLFADNQLQADQLQIYFRLGRVLEKLGQPEEAIACYRQTLALQQAGSSWSQKAQEQLQLKSYPLGLPHHLCSADHTLLSPTVPTCDGLDCTSCLERIFGWFQPLHLGNSVYACSKQVTLPVASPSLFTTMLPGGRTWVAPQKNSWLICNAIATLTSDHHLLLDLSRDYPGQLPGCKDFNPTQHRIFNLEAMPPLEQVDGVVAVLAGLSGHIYFHWMIDILPRIEILRQSGVDLKEIDWFLINSDRQSFQQQTLAALGIPSEKLLLSDHHPHIQAQRLIVPAFTGPIGWAQPWVLKFLRRVFLPQASDRVDQNYPERIYISRKRAKYRRVLNEVEVVEQLSKFGFVSVALETLSFVEQIAVFANAKAIVSPHGSGLTNLAFCSQGTQVMEFFSPHYIRHYYWVISNYLSLDHYYLLGKGFACQPLRELMYQNPLTEDILIDLNALQAMLRKTGLCS